MSETYLDPDRVTTFEMEEAFWKKWYQCILEEYGVARYFGAFISSSSVGVMKPDPRIYRTALQTLNVEAEDSIYIDDYRVEADGARALGITAFHLDRQQIEQTTDVWTIRNLRQVVSFLQE